MPDAAKNQDLTLQDLRVILHGLKMSGFASIEPEALDQIRFRIKSLPGPEELNDLSDDPASLKRIAKEVGEIMHLLEIYGKKGPEFKARFESLKGMPPRYKVLEWRKANMNNTEFVRQVIKLSAIADSKGHVDVASQLTVLAKNALEDKDISNEIAPIIATLRDAKMEKEAGFFGDLWGGIQDVRTNKGDRQIISQIQKDIVAVRNQLKADIDKFQGSINKMNERARQIKSPQRQQSALAIINQFDVKFEGLEILSENIEQQLAQLAQSAVASGTESGQGQPQQPQQAPAAKGKFRELRPQQAQPQQNTSSTPNGFPQVSDPKIAADYANQLEKLLSRLGSSNKMIVLAQANMISTDPQFKEWYNQNASNPEAVKQAIQYLKGVAGGTAAPTGVANELPLSGSNVGKAQPGFAQGPQSGVEVQPKPSATPEASATPPAAPAPTSAATPEASATPPAAPAVPPGTEQSYEFLKQIGVTGLEPIPNAENQYKGKDGKIWSIVPAKTASTNIRMIRIV